MCFGKETTGESLKIGLRINIGTGNQERPKFQSVNRQ